MGFDEGRMVLDSPNGTYFSGQTVQGKLIFQQDKVKSFRGIYVKLKGFCHVHWTTTRTRTVNGRQQSYTVNHNSHEEYINAKVYLVGGESGEHSIQPGNHEYPFHFRLPVNCPSSFEGEYGHIRYEIKAVVDRSFKFDQEKKVAVRVMAPLDLNLDPYCREPIEMQLQESYCCCCVSSGSTEVLVKLPVAGYCPGQTVPVEVSCSNKGGIGIDDIKLKITKKITFIATSEPGQRKDKDTVVEIKKGPVPTNTNRNWTVEMEVPAMDVYNLSGCRYIDLEYKFKVVISPDGCHSDSEETRRVVIGTIPLVGFQDNVQNPLHDQLPQQVAIIQQPMSSYPPVVNVGDPPQPFGNQPINPPYPTVQPYPGNSPYPPANPYPDDSMKPNPPYPQTNSPYPSPNPPYPQTGSVYPPSNTPYPVTSSPYPAPNPYTDNPPPYPGNMTNPTSSHPGGNPPYPGGNPPYPPHNVPYQAKPNVMPSPGNIGGLKTGNFGFIVAGGTGIPLPPNAASPVPANPYATASAPAPDTPDTALPQKKD